MSKIQVPKEPKIIVEGVPFPVEPIEVLGFSSPLADEVISTLVSNIRSRSNSLQIDLLDQLHSETKRARLGEVASRNKTIALHIMCSSLKSKTDTIETVSNKGLQENFSLADIGTFSDDHIAIVKATAIWIRAKTLAEVEVDGLDHCIHQNDVVTDADINKSKMFERIRDGKSPLVHRPPTAFGQPWYEVLESNLLFRVQVAVPKALLDKLVSNNSEAAINEKILINKCEWRIDKVIELGKEYELLWPHTDLKYTLKRSNNLLDSQNGHEQGWTLQKIESRGSV